MSRWQRCPVCGGEGRVYRMTAVYEQMAMSAPGPFGWTGPTHEYRKCRVCGGTGLLDQHGQPPEPRR